jgi:hypothetical protein
MLANCAASVVDERKERATHEVVYLRGLYPKMVLNFVMQSVRLDMWLALAHSPSFPRPVIILAQVWITRDMPRWEVRIRGRQERQGQTGRTRLGRVSDHVVEQDVVAVLDLVHHVPSGLR